MDVVVVYRLDPTEVHVAEEADVLSSSVSPRASRDVIANGWNVVWRHAGPPGSVMIGAMTFTS
jgi:hypothetical protein